MVAREVEPNYAKAKWLVRPLKEYGLERIQLVLAGMEIRYPKIRVYANDVYFTILTLRILLGSNHDSKPELDRERVTRFHELETLLDDWLEQSGATLEEVELCLDLQDRQRQLQQTEVFA